MAKDEAFCFYYRDNLRMLEYYGAELVYFSLLHDKTLPDNIHGLLLGGGYPELYAKQLAENESMRKSIKEALEQQLPSLAECGDLCICMTRSQTGREQLIKWQV